MSRPTSSAADLTYRPDPDDPERHVYISGDPVPPAARKLIKELGGTYRAPISAWRIPTRQARQVWERVPSLADLTQTWENAPPAPRVLSECSACHAPRWTTENGTHCPECGQAAPVLGSPDAAPAPHRCHTCGQTHHGRPHCPRSSEHVATGKHCRDCGTASCIAPEPEVSPVAPWTAQGLTWRQWLERDGRGTSGAAPCTSGT